MNGANDMSGLTSGGEVMIAMLLWIVMVWWLARVLAAETAAEIPRGAMLKLLLSVFTADCFAMFVALFPLAILPQGSVGRMVMVVAIFIAASVWNGDCFFRRCASFISADPKVRRKRAIEFGIGSSPLLLWLGIFSYDWLQAAGPGVARAEFEFFSLELVIAPLVILLLCPRERRPALLDGLAVLRVLLLAVMAAAAAVEGHIFAHFMQLTMGTPLFVAVWGISAGIFLELVFREFYAPLLFDDPAKRRVPAVLFGALANPIWPILAFGMHGLQF